MLIMFYVKAGWSNVHGGIRGMLCEILITLKPTSVRRMILQIPVSHVCLYTELQERDRCLSPAPGHRLLVWVLSLLPRGLASRQTPHHHSLIPTPTHHESAWKCGLYPKEYSPSKQTDFTSFLPQGGYRRPAQWRMCYCSLLAKQKEALSVQEKKMTVDDSRTDLQRAKYQGLKVKRGRQ